MLPALPALHIPEPDPLQALKTLHKNTQSVYTYLQRLRDALTDSVETVVAESDAAIGVLSINSLTARHQLLTAVSDTNLALSISSATDTHTFTLAWAGILSLSRGGTGAANTAVPAGYVLRSNATAFVGAQLAASDLSNSITGSGQVVLSFTPTILAPILTAPSIDRISNLTTNGFVKTTGGNGTLTVDSTSTFVNSVSNSDGTLTISPTTGNVVVSLNLAHSNTWTAAQSITAAGQAFTATNTFGSLFITEFGLTDDFCAVIQGNTGRNAHLFFSEAMVGDAWDIHTGNGDPNLYFYTGIGVGGVYQAHLSPDGVFHVETGFRIGISPTAGHVLRSNGTNFVDAALAAEDLSNGVFGTGAVVLSIGGGLSSVTPFSLRDSSAAFNVTITPTSSPSLTAGRTLTLNMGNVAHTLALGTTANTITFPNTASDTVAMLGVDNIFTALQTINFNSGALPSAPSGTLLQLGGADTTNSFFVFNSFGAASGIVGLRARGTNASPLALAAGNRITAFIGRGYDGTSYSTDDSGYIGIFALTAWTNANHETYLAFFTTANGATGAGVERGRIALGLMVGTTTDSGAGTIRANAGFYTDQATFMLHSTTAWNNGAAGNTGTLTNAPAAGNPTKWLPIDDNGTTRYIPAW